MTEEQLRVLKAMNEITNRIDLNAFAQMVGLTPNQTIECVQELVNAGFMRKVGSGYGITEKGKNILKAIAPAPKDMAFRFYTGIGQPSSFSAESPKDFYEIVTRVAVESLEFHLYRKDFENWIKNALKDSELAEEFAKLRAMKLKGEDLRKEMMKTLAATYGI